MSKKKYSKEFKLKVLKEHEEGASFYSLEKKKGVDALKDGRGRNKSADELSELKKLRAEKSVQTGSMTEMKMVIWILQIRLFSYKICITERAIHMRSIRYSHMLQRKIYAWI